MKCVLKFAATVFNAILVKQLSPTMQEVVSRYAGK